MKTTEPGIASRFIEEVEQRCKRIGISPEILCVTAGLSYNTWRGWTKGMASPTASKMDEVLKALAKQEAK